MPKRDGYAEHIRRRWPGIHGEALPVTPGEPALRALLAEHPAYRLVVEYLDRFTVEAAVCHRQLAPSIRGAVSNWGQTVERQKAAARVRAAVFDEGKPSKLWRAKPRPSGRSLAKLRPFSVLLGWVLMTLDNLAAKSRPEVLAIATDIVRRRKAIAVEDVLRWSYVPRAVIGLLDVRLGEAKERRADAPAVRRLRQIQARDLPIPPDLHGLGLEPIDRRQAAHWWTGLGLDKLSSRSSAQEFWLLVFEPLIDRLCRSSGKLQPHQASLRRACNDASQLVNARYPDPWEHRPDRLRKRHSYTARRSDRRP